VAGWCDIARHARLGFRHAGTMGMALLPAYRGQGWGKKLLLEVMDAARAMGIWRIELEVFASNTNAIALYESLGFQREGYKRRAKKLDGRYDDDIVMALLFPDPDPA
jgi:ribosomal protein S18 acetylase RimI-like enzyme